MSKFLALAPAVLAVAAFGAHARTSVPIVNYENVAVSNAAGQPATTQQIKAAVQSAASQRGWQLSAPGPNGTVATLNVRGKHTLATEISYGAGQYSVRYKSSINLNYEPGEGAGLIHPNYNKWVQGLVDAIRIEAGRQ